MNVENIVWKDKNLDQKVVLNTKKEREMQQSGKETIMWQKLMTKNPTTIWLTNLLHQALPKNNTMHSGFRGHYHIHCDPFFGVGRQAVRRIPCCCESCIEIIESERVEGE